MTCSNIYSILLFRKTGKTVNQVSRDADDFEPFEQVLDQAYRGSVPRPANTRSKTVNGHSLRDQSPLGDNVDDSGELSMDIDSSELLLQHTRAVMK